MEYLILGEGKDLLHAWNTDETRPTDPQGYSVRPTRRDTNVGQLPRDALTTGSHPLRWNSMQIVAAFERDFCPAVLTGVNASYGSYTFSGVGVLRNLLSLLVNKPEAPKLIDKRPAARRGEPMH